MSLRGSGGIPRAERYGFESGQKIV